MDPNATLATIRMIIAAEDYPLKVGDLSDRINALDEWLSKGGFLPDDWRDR